jgi:DNA-binding NarL/FixJ family response regulator
LERRITVIDAFVVTGMRAYQDALSQALDASGRVHVAGSASHPAAALGAVGSMGPLVVLLDPPGPVGPAWARDLAAASASARVLVMGLTQAEAELGAWARAGVVGYTGVDATLENLIRAIERAFRSGPRLEAVAASPPRVRIDLVSGPEDAQRRLTLREHEIMRLVGEGYSNQQIARRLCIALGTVKNHIHNVLEKLDVQTRLEAVNAVRRVGFVRWHDDTSPMLMDGAPAGPRVTVAVGSG